MRASTWGTARRGQEEDGTGGEGSLLHWAAVWERGAAVALWVYVLDSSLPSSTHCRLLSAGSRARAAGDGRRLLAEGLSKGRRGRVVPAPQSFVKPQAWRAQQS